jgi:hypothetical protein
MAAPFRQCRDQQHPVGDGFGARQGDFPGQPAAHWRKFYGKRISGSRLAGHGKVSVYTKK